MTNRRRFLHQSLLAAGGSFFIARDLLAGIRQDDVVLGQGDFRYRLVKGWGQLDRNRFPIKDCHEIQQDRRGRLFVLGNETRNNVLVYDTSGKLLDAWGHQFPGGHGLTLWDANGEECLFITDPQNHEVYKTTLGGKVLMTLPFPADVPVYTKKEEYKPTETAVMPNGDIYVADGYGKDLILRYNAKGELLGYFGGQGTGDQHLENAHGVALDLRNPQKPEILVTSRKQNAFKRFTPEGQYLRTVPLPGAYNCRPVLHGRQLFFAVLISRLPWNSETGYITILDDQDRVLSNLNGTPPVYENNKLQPMQQQGNVFKHPHDVWIDRDENLYVAQWNSGQVYPMKLERI